MPPDHNFYYEGFTGPNGTIVPDDVFDVLAPHLKESELRVLLYIVRRTFGFGKRADAISLRQLTDGIQTRDGRTLDYGTGMSRKAVVAGVRGLAEKGIITVQRQAAERGDQAVNIYRLRFRDSNPVTESNHPGDLALPPPVTKGNDRGVPNTPSPVTQSDTQDTVQDSGLHNTTGHTVVDLQYTQAAALSRRLKELGVHHNTVGRILRQHELRRIEAVAAHVEMRLKHGWCPEESPAAWIVAALREGYEVSRDDKDDSSQVERAGESERGRRQSEALVEVWRQERASVLERYGIEQNMEKLWRTVQERMREAGAWSPVLATAMLRQADERTIELLIPGVVRERTTALIGAIADAVCTELGEKYDIKVRCLK